MARRRKSSRRTGSSRPAPPRHPVTGKFMSKAEVAELEAECANTPPSAEELRQRAEADAQRERQRVEEQARHQRVVQSGRMRREDSVNDRQDFSPLERRLHRQARKRGLDT